MSQLGGALAVQAECPSGKSLSYWIADDFLDWAMADNAVVWTEDNRKLYERKGLRYPSDMTDAEWALIDR